MSNGSAQPLTSTTPQSSDGVVAQQYLGVAADNLITHNEAAAGAFKGSEQHRGDAAKALAQAAVTLTSDEEAENRDLTQLIKDVATLEHAGACPTVTIIPPPTTSTARGGGFHEHHHDDGGRPTTTTTVPPTTTTTTVPPTHDHHHDDAPTGLADADHDHHDDPADDHHHDSATGNHDTTTTTLPGAAVPAHERPAPGSGRRYSATGLHRDLRATRRRLTPVRAVDHGSRLTF